jgi:hypothetical protein
MTTPNDSVSPCDCEEACGCYVEGYAAGKDKAFFEIQSVPGSGHEVDCPCNPCATSRVLVVRITDSFIFNMAPPVREAYDRWLADNGQ